MHLRAHTNQRTHAPTMHLFSLLLLGSRNKLGPTGGMAIGKSIASLTILTSLNFRFDPCSCFSPEKLVFRLSRFRDNLFLFQIGVLSLHATVCGWWSNWNPHLLAIRRFQQSQNMAYSFDFCHKMLNLFLSFVAFSSLRSPAQLAQRWVTADSALSHHWTQRCTQLSLVPRGRNSNLAIPDRRYVSFTSAVPWFEFSWHLSVVSFIST